ncbi:MAG: hypothetical protein HN790_15420 [Methylococcales bacterium]|jgi:hypothetical protein|nr:hypothetical protein [Methylococcales bacterium]
MALKPISVRGLLEIAAIITLSLSLISLIPDLPWVLAILTSFKIQYAVASFLLSIIFILYRRKIFAGILLISFIVHSIAIIPPEFV